MSGEGGRKASEDDDQALNEHDEAMTCSVLCSLGSTDHPAPAAAVAAATSSCDVPQQCDDIGDDDSSDFPSSTNKARRKLPITVPKCCPKQLQLPMFLSSKYLVVFSSSE